MSCNIPSFNFDFKVIYDISLQTPTVEIQQASTGANLAAISYFFILYDPNGNIYHNGSWLSPDAIGVWSSISIAEPLPQSGMHMEFSNLPFRVVGYAKDASGNICTLEKMDVLCAPAGNDGKNNFGKIVFDIRQQCDKAKLQIRDITQYIYSGGTGLKEDNMLTFVYPTNEGTPLPNITLQNNTAFSIPIPYNGEGHEMYAHTIILYTLANGDQVRVKYKYSNKNIIINCGISRCSIMCGLTKYRQKLEGSSGTCTDFDSKKVLSLTLKIAQLLFATDSPDCGIDSNALNAEIKEELLANDCYCECDDKEFNNGSTSLKCADIDIACVYTEIINLINSDVQAKGLICTIVNDCINATNATACAQPFISSAIFTETGISLAFMLANQTNSTSLKIYFKLHDDPSWTLFDTIASNETQYDISSIFNAGDIYDVKVSNVCASGEVDSSIIKGTIIQPMSSCSLLTTIYTGLADGIYMVQVDSTQAIDCNKIKPVKLTPAFMSPFLPCSMPGSLKINSSSLLTWSGDPGDYQIFYKKKTDLLWTDYGINTYMAIDNSQDLSALALTPLADYEFKIKHVCNSGSLYSIPAHTEYFDPLSRCESAGSFISFNQTTGELLWAGGTNGTATYVAQASTGGTSLGTPASIIITATPFGTQISCDYSSIAALIAATTIGPGDEIIFSIKQECSIGVFSDVATKNYIIESVSASCNNTTLTFTTGNGGLVTLSSSTFPSNVNELQYQVGLQLGPTFIPLVIGQTTTEITSVYLPVAISNGAQIKVRWRASCGCCSNISSYSNWDEDTASATSQDWDDEWKDIPSGWMLNGVQIKMGAGVGQYKIDRQGKFHLRGLADFVSATSPGPYTYPVGTTSIDMEFLDISALSSILNASTNLTGTVDYFPATEKAPLMTSGLMPVTGSIQRNDFIFKLVAKIVNGGSGSSNGLQINLSHISIN